VKEMPSRRGSRPVNVASHIESDAAHPFNTENQFSPPNCPVIAGFFVAGFLRHNIPAIDIQSKAKRKETFL
jgi:hypothetical protein